MSKLIDLTGLRFERLVVEERAVAPEGAKEVYWRCRCDCGNIAIVRGTHLRQGKIKSCGCYGKSHNKIDMTGLRFGKLVVIQEAEKRADANGPSWICKCDCGNIKTILGRNLRSGTTKSCGCLNIEQASVLGSTNMIDLSNQHFGRLIALHPTDKRYARNVVWHCVCSCGKELDVPSNLLREKKVSSCGCLGRSRGEEAIRKFLTEEGVLFEQEKCFETCRADSGYPLRFDFFVENKYAIEFDGEQHFKATSGWNTEDHLKQVQQRDAVKTEWCQNNNIPLIRIPYYHLDNLTFEDLDIKTSRFIVKKEKENKYVE